MTPIMIHIAAHYERSTVDFPNLHFPAVKRALNKLIKAGLIEHMPKKEAKPTHQYRGTRKLALLIEALCSVAALMVWPDD